MKNASTARRRLRIGAFLFLCIATVALSPGVEAYQQYSVQSGSTVVPLRWNRLPVQYYIENVAASGISAAQLQSAVDRAFTTWHNVSTAGVSAQFVGYTSAAPFEDDGQVVIGFLNEPDQQDVLGATDYLIDDRTGAIVESDIFFNSAFPWSVAASGEANRFDLESIALHEIGHLWGLGHSALGETQQVTGGRQVIAAGAVMFPIAFSPGNVKQRVLQPDDIAGISDLYPAGGFQSETGSVTGVVTKGGKNVFGAHVVAFSPSGGAMVGNFTNEDGSFIIAGLKPGLVVLRVEPVDDADLDSFFDHPSTVDINFKITYSNRLAVVPSGGASAKVQIQVAPK
jgi:hypothetical protein